MSKTFIGGAVCREFQSEAPIRTAGFIVYDANFAKYHRLAKGTEP